MFLRRAVGAVILLLLLRLAVILWAASGHGDKTQEEGGRQGVGGEAGGYMASVTVFDTCYTSC